ncbi:MAG: prolipoprotein diacylglyceryl transferase [Clostridiaceae bacterium]|nr:prolipoprotein diacylglyceryl transferase [Clostridiaceae bacterium]
MQPIGFPGLGLEFNIDPVAFRAFGIPIYWYGIIISIGFMIAVILAHYEARRVGLNSEVILDVALYGTPSAIVGARLYYVLFNWSFYKNNIMEIFSIRHGGMAIYGAILAALLSTVIYCKINKVDLWKVCDIGALGLLIAQAIGRWGNFVNQEAYGGPTRLPWRMEIFDIDAQARISVHPTFLYESLWNLVGFLFLFWYRKRKKFDGEIFLLYGLWYGLGRFWIEGMRADSLYWGSFRISQVVAFVSVFLCAGLLIYYRKNKKAY